MNEIHVLLVSPRLVATDDRYCGDHAYTDMLLEAPPERVCYHHYDDLIENGRVHRCKWLYRIGPRLVRWGLLPPDLWAEYLISEIVPDIVHIYGFSALVRLPSSAREIPVLLGAGTGSYSDLKYYLNWPTWAIQFARWRKRQYLRLIDAHDSSLRPEHATRVHVWSKFSRDMHLEEGYVQSNKIEVLYPGLPWRGGGEVGLRRARATTFLFIGSDFERKNGSLVLRAFRRVRERCPGASLIIVGRPKSGMEIRERGVVHHRFLPRSELFERIYPQADALVLPSKAEGFGLVLLEAMSFGMPVIALDAWAMREVIEDGESGFLIAEAELGQLIDRMTQVALMDKSVWMTRVKRSFEKRFSLERHNRKLRRIYDRVLSGNGMA